MINPEIKNWLKSFIMELVVYAALVVGYYFLVLHFLGDWIFQLFKDDRKIYAATALGLIVGQGIALEALTRALLAIAKPRAEDQ
jgi:hypothetical protein